MRSAAKAYSGGNPVARHALRLAWIGAVPDIEPRPRVAEAMDADLLFSALDGSSVRLFDHSWSIRVLSITQQHGWRWLQLLLEGEPEHCVTIRTSVTTTPNATIRYLATWLANPAKHPASLTVA